MNTVANNIQASQAYLTRQMESGFHSFARYHESKRRKRCQDWKETG